MKNIIRLLLITLVALLLACASVPDNGSQNTNNDAPEILQVLPENIEGFIYRGIRTYPDPLGYSLVYQYERNQLAYADVYVFPVPKEADGYSYIEVVKGMTAQALQDIETATEQGAYSEYSIISSNSFKTAGRFTTRADVFLVKDNLASFSLVFLTESNGKLLKVRMTMPDNNSNRSNDNWQKFVVSMFTLLIENIEKA